MKPRIGATCPGTYPKAPPLNEIPLKPCPFCGGKARIRVSNIYMNTGYRVQCNDCATGTVIVSVGMYLMWRGEYNKTFTDDEAAAESARVWNERDYGEA